MSPLSPDRLRLHLGQHGWRLQDISMPQAGLWNTLPSAVLIETLRLPDGKRRLEVILELAWARSQLISFPAAVRSTAERQAYTQAIFNDLHGLDPQTWQIITEPVLAGLPVLAAAIEHETLRALQALASRHRMRLASIQPAFSALWNSLRHQANEACGALAWFADGRMSLGVWRKGVWLALRHEPMTAGDGEALVGMLQRLLTGCGMHEAGVLYCAGATFAEGLRLPAGWRCEQLSLRGDAP